jgi:hypothetical protein
MVYLFLSALLLGLVLGVVVMLVGVERRPRRSTTAVAVDGLPFSAESVRAASSEISARFHLPIVASFATMFGAVGYPLARYGSLGMGGRLIIPIVAGLVAALGAVVLIARWAVPSARRDIPDERYLWQGLPARVTVPIDAVSPGRITVEVDGTRHAVTAVSLNGDPIDQGSDVVIERIENGAAFVEPWASVERRL